MESIGRFATRNPWFVFLKNAAHLSCRSSSLASSSSLLASTTSSYTFVTCRNASTITTSTPQKFLSKTTSTKSAGRQIATLTDDTEADQQSSQTDTTTTNGNPIDWNAVKFNYIRTDNHVEYTFANGQWDEGQTCENPEVTIHIMSAALHYGQQIYEGLKAFRCKDGKIRVFQPNNANALRLQEGCARMCMPVVPVELFNDAITRVVRQNARWTPPFGKGSLYIRPNMFGCGPQISLSPAPSYKLTVQVLPVVGSYYGSDGANALLVKDYDRAAPRGTGGVKCGGNYGGDLFPSRLANQQGFQTCLYTDAATGKFVEEFSVSNFVAISESGAYITPRSDTILKSITNRALMQLARDRGLSVEIRDISVDELPTLKEVAAVGTAVVVNPIQSITCQDATYKFPGINVLGSLRDELCGIQRGTVADRHNWMMEI